MQPIVLHTGCQMAPTAVTLCTNDATCTCIHVSAASNLQTMRLVCTPGLQNKPQTHLGTLAAGLVHGSWLLLAADPTAAGTIVQFWFRLPCPDQIVDAQLVALSCHPVHMCHSKHMEWLQLPCSLLQAAEGAQPFHGERAQLLSAARTWAVLC